MNELIQSQKDSEINRRLVACNSAKETAVEGKASLANFVDDEAYERGVLKVRNLYLISVSLFGQLFPEIRTKYPHLPRII